MRRVKGTVPRPDERTPEEVRREAGQGDLVRTAAKEARVQARVQVLEMAIQEAKEKNTTLAGLDDQIMEAIDKVETLLRTYLPVKVSWDAPTADASQAAVRRLSFGKHAGKWQLIVDFDGGTQPLRNTDRTVRAQIFETGILEQLLRRSVVLLDAYIEMRHEALRVAASIITALETPLKGNTP